MGTGRLDRVLRLVRSHRPGLRLVDRRGLAVARWVAVLVRPFAPDFPEGTTVVLGDTVYLPRAPDELDPDLLAAILCHELVHQLDQARHPLFYPTYLLGPPLPVVRTARADWERRAYAVDLMIAHHERGEPGLRRTLDRLVEIFAGSSYGWMWAGRGAAAAYLAPIADRVREGTLQRDEPYRSILAAWTGPGATSRDLLAGTERAD